MKMSIICLLIVFAQGIALGQVQDLDKYVTDLKDISNPAFSKLDTILTRSKKNVFLLSESSHPSLNLATTRFLLTGHMNGLMNVQKVVDEFPLAGASMLFGYSKNEINSSLFHDSVYSIGYNEEDIPENAKGLSYVADYVDAEFNFYIKESNMLDEFKYYMANGIEDKIIPIDIGFNTQFLEKSYLAWLTKKRCDNQYVQNFCDSMAKHGTGQFQLFYVFHDSQKTYERKLLAMQVFLDSLMSHCPDSTLYFAWKNAFAGYLFSQRTKRKRLLDPEFKPLTTLEFMDENSFRDSILYENFKWAMPDSFQNVIVSFSTLHLMDTRNTEYFSDVMPASTKTLGRYLHNDTIYSKYLKRIAFICDDTHRNDEKFKRTNARQSLEYELSIKHDLAYIDLEGYRNAIPEVLRKPFYMRPTFWTYRKLNWEEIFDGVVFVKDCGCK